RCCATTAVICRCGRPGKVSDTDAPHHAAASRRAESPATWSEARGEETRHEEAAAPLQSAHETLPGLHDRARKARRDREAGRAARSEDLGADPARGRGGDPL